MQAWLSLSGVDIATIGFLSLVGLPYTFKFLWAPLMDRFELPWLGRRRGWLVLTQLMLAAALWWMAATSPTGATRAFALIAVLVAFISASQDIVIDAYRTNLLPSGERGLGSSALVLGYRLAMILSGGVAFIWVDPAQGGGWTWPGVYRLMAGLMAAAALLSALALPRLAATETPRSVARRDLLGFFAVVAAVAFGVVLSNRYARPLADVLFGPVMAHLTASHALQGKWLDLVALLLGLAFTVPLAVWTARAIRFETLLGGLSSYFAQPGAAAFLAVVVLYKLGDAFSLSLVTPFLLQAMHFNIAEVGVVNKIFGLWLTIGGALLGGAVMLRIGLWRALMYFGIFQMAGVLCFWWLAANGRGALPGLTIPAFDWGFVRLAQPTPVDGGLLFAVAGENLSGGMGTAALIAFQMSLCNQRYTATQFALLSAFSSIGRVWVGPLAGVLAESIGWPAFFLVSTATALPALVLLWWLRGEVRLLERDPAAPPAAA
ncbi:MAG: MFS transporter [Pseudomonadota bacterium]|nr:MFS transporter [Pseudomonadota bacterium]